MSRRHDSLTPLSHDHHHALHNARLLRKAADGDEQGRVSAAAEFMSFFRTDGVRHFRQEEEELFPQVIDVPLSPVDGIERVLVEHVRLHALMMELERQHAAAAVDPGLMRTLATQLREHVRFEEDELFPAIERAAGDAI